MKTVATLLDLIQQSLNTTGKACWRCPTWRAWETKSMLSQSHRSPQSITLQAKPALTDQGDPSRNQLSGVRRKGALLSTLYLIVDF